MNVVAEKNVRDISLAFAVFSYGLSAHQMGEGPRKETDHLVGVLPSVTASNSLSLASPPEPFSQG